MEMNIIIMKNIIAFETTLYKIEIAWLVLFLFKMILFCESRHFYESKEMSISSIPDAIEFDKREYIEKYTIFIFIKNCYIILTTQH